MRISVRQSRIFGVALVLVGIAWIAWEESAKAGYVELPPVTGLAPWFIAIGIVAVYFYPRSLKGK